MSEFADDLQSVGSVISLRSARDDDVGALSEGRRGRRPASGSKGRKPASPYGTPAKKKSTKKVGRDVWMNAIQGGGGLSTENAVLTTWKNGRPKNMKNQTTATDYLLDQFTMRNGPIRPTSASSPSARVGGKGPVYKDAESYYDDIQALKRTLKQVRTEHDLLKAKNGRLQDENISKSRKIEELLNPDSQSNDLRRTLTSKNPNGNEVVMSLKRRIYKLEENLRNKENEMRKLSSELKVTDMEELKFENQMCLIEIRRLHKVVEDLNDKGGNFISEEVLHDALKDNKSNKAQILLKRLTDDNRNLVLENKSLKNDLLKLTKTDGTNISLDKDYEDMNRKELLQKIMVLEQQLKEEEKRDGKKEQKDDTEKTDPEIIDDRCIELKGPLQQQIKQLRARERELLTEVDQLEVTVKKLKEDRAHYRKMTDDFRKQMEDTKKEATTHESDHEKNTPRLQRKRSSNAPRKSSVRSNEEQPESPPSKEKIAEKVEPSSSSARERRNSKKSNSSTVDKTETLEEDVDEYEEAIVSVQSAWRAHKTRLSYVDTKLASSKKVSSYDRYEKEEEDEDLFDDDVLLIQSAFRAHTVRKRLIDEKEHMKNQRIRSGSRLSEQSRSYHNSAAIPQQDDESDDDDDVVVGSSTSLTRFRNDDHNERARSRNPTIYRDPDTAKNQRHRGGSRTKGNLSTFFDDEIEEEQEDPRRRRNTNTDSMGRSKDMSINKLKSSSQPWENSPNETNESDDDSRRFSQKQRKSTTSKAGSTLSKTASTNRESVTNKWAESGSKEKKKIDEQNFKHKLSMRKTQQLLKDFSVDEKDVDDDDDDDLMIAPSFQKKMTAAMKKKSALDDELF